MLITSCKRLPARPAILKVAATSYGITGPVAVPSNDCAWRGRPAIPVRNPKGVANMVYACRWARKIRARLLHVARHVTVEHHPDVHRAVNFLDVLQHVRIGNLDFD